MLLFKDKINYKLPSGNGFGAHLDAPAYDHIARIEHLTANIAVDEATPENGCIEVVPGSHKMDIGLENGGAISKIWEDSHEWVQVPLSPGDMLLFGSHLAHRSGPNHTSSDRGSIYATYYNKSEGLDLRQKYYAHRKENFPPAHGEFLGFFISFKETDPCDLSQSVLLEKITRKDIKHTLLHHHLCQKKRSSKKHPGWVVCSSRSTSSSSCNEIPAALLQWLNEHFYENSTSFYTCSFECNSKINCRLDWNERISFTFVKLWL